MHLEGIKQESEVDEASQRWVCPAFPDGIPDDIAFGDNLHGKPDPRQEPGTEEIVYKQAGR